MPRPFLPTLCLLLFLVSACGGRRYHFDFFEKSTELHFPAGTRLLDYYDSGEFYAVAVFQVPQGDLAGFIAANDFGPLGTSTDIFGLTELQAPYQNLPPSRQQTCAGGERWSGFLDAQSGC